MGLLNRPYGETRMSGEGQKPVAGFVFLITRESFCLGYQGCLAEMLLVVSHDNPSNYRGWHITDKYLP